MNFIKTHTPQSFASRSDVGNVREHNEDSLLVASPLFVVADGMGGHEAGEVASRIAVETMRQRVPKKASPEALAASVIEANEAVLRGAADGTGRPGMGTTVTAALIYDDEVVIAQVGDSRAYLLHENVLQRITRDHSLVADLIEQGRLTEEEARFHPQRSVITRALGSDVNMQPDIYSLRVEKGDRLVLCSDGLSSMISDEAIESIMLENEYPQEACDELVDEALAAGGLDNVTVIVIDPLGEPPEEDLLDKGDFVEEIVVGEPPETLDDEDEDEQENAIASPAMPMSHTATSMAPQGKPQKKKEKKPKRKGRFAPLFWTIAFVLILAVAAGGFYYYAQHSYYLIEEGGVVCVYRGLPGSIGSLSLSWLEEKASDVDVSKLNPTTQSRLENGISVNSLDEAQKLLSDYRATVNVAQAVTGNANSQQGSSVSTPDQTQSREEQR